MYKLTLEVDQETLDAFALAYNWETKRPDLKLGHDVSIFKTKTKEEFLDQRLMEYLSQVVKGERRKTATKTADDSVKAMADPAVSVVKES